MEDNNESFKSLSNKRINDSSYLKHLSNFYDESEDTEEEEEEEDCDDLQESFSSIKGILNESTDNFADLNQFLNNENIIIEANYNQELYINSKKSYFRFIPSKKEWNELFQTCHYIPLIKVEKNSILFHDVNGRGINLNKSEITNLIYNNELFIKNEKNNEKDIINESYICKIHKKNYFKYCIKCQVNICDHEQCLNDHKNHELNEPINIKKKLRRVQKRINKKFNKKIKAYNDVTKIGDEPKNFFFFFIKAIYYFILKKIIKEKLEMDRQKKYNYYIEKNIMDAYYFIKSGGKKKKNENPENLIIYWITEFYSKIQINNLNQGKNIFISICSSSYIIIHSFNLSKNTKKSDLKSNINELIKKKVNILEAQKIMRLEGCFNPNDKEKNYFLIGSLSKEKALIISVTHDLKNIETVQKINSKGIISSIEINHNNIKYLLQNNNDVFNLWEYDYINDNINFNLNIINEKKGLKFKIIQPQIKANELKTPLINKDNINIKYNQIIAFIENMNLIIAHHISSRPSLSFYKLEKNEKININIIGEIMPREDQNIFSTAPNNCCIFENNYLIIGAQEKKEYNKFGGFYIINIDKIEIINYYISDNAKIINCLMNVQENMFICSLIYHINFHEREFLRRKLILYEFIIKGEKNKELIINEKSKYDGNFSLINSNSLILDNFIISSFKKESSLIKIYENKINYISLIKIDNPDIIKNKQIKEFI